MPEPRRFPGPEATIKPAVRPDARRGGDHARVRDPAASRSARGSPLAGHRRETLFKVVRTLEEIGPVDADLVDLLDRAADLIEGCGRGQEGGAA